MSDAQRDRLLAVLTAVLALSYTSAARNIEDSLLADAVGAGGVPQGVGIALLLCAVGLFAKSFVVRPAAPEASSEASAPAAEKTKPEAGVAAALAPGAILVRTVALVLLLVGYGVVLPVLGYALSLSLLVLGAGALAGAALRWPLVLTAALAGPLLWLLFDQVLQVRMPPGTLWS